MKAVIFVILLLMLLSGCASKTSDIGQPVEGSSASTPPASRYSLLNDQAPVNPPDVSQVPDAVPRFEPPSRGGNRSPYEVFGQRYYVLPSAQGYRETGIASWYGKKFHGHLTSNGEVYDMYEMTAAHKSLPLPTFARVTNLDNGRSVIVRINDRGPFHGNRLIDLSYAAAYRLDVLQQGTGRVEVEAITVNPDEVVTHTGMARQSLPAGESLQASRDRPYLQVGAFSTQAAAQRVQRQLQSILTNVTVGIYPANPSGSTVYRVKIGPLDAGEPLDQLIVRLASAGFHQPHLVNQP